MTLLEVLSEFIQLFGIYNIHYSCWNHYLTTEIPMYSVLSTPRECDWRATSYDGMIWADRSTSPDPTLWRAIPPGKGDNVSDTVRKTISMTLQCVSHRFRQWHCQWRRWCSSIHSSIKFYNKTQWECSWLKIFSWCLPTSSMLYKSECSSQQRTSRVSGLLCN